MRESRQQAKCHEPLELTVEAQQAFADRQLKLLNKPEWPFARWYSDEDFCRAYNTACQLQTEIERLQADLAGFEAGAQAEADAGDEARREVADLLWLLKHEWQRINPDVHAPDFIMVARNTREAAEAAETTG